MSPSTYNIKPYCCCCCYHRKAWRRISCYMWHSHSQTNLPSWVGADWAADCAMQWFDIFGSIDYNYTFFWSSVELLITGGIEKRCIYLAFWNKRRLALFLTGTFLQPILPPIPVLPPPNKKIWHDSITWHLIWSNRKFQKLLPLYDFKTWQGQFWCFKSAVNNKIAVIFCFLKLAKQIKFSVFISVAYCI